MQAITTNQQQMSLHQPSKSQKYSSSRRKIVRFSESNFVQHIPHRKDFSPSQIQDCYYSSEELQTIRAVCVDTVSHISEEGGVKDNEGYYLRGLDQHTLKYKQQQEVMCKHLYDIVDAFQRYQDKTGIDVSETMGELCEKHSAPAVSAAQISAVSDLFSAFKGSWAKRETPVIEDIPAIDGKNKTDSAPSQPTTGPLVGQ